MKGDERSLLHGHALPCHVIVVSISHEQNLVAFLFLLFGIAYGWFCFVLFCIVIIKAGLLMCNALLILNRRRFLSKYGLDDMMNARGGGGGNAAALANNPLVQQAAGLLHAVQYLKVPVIVCNILIIVFELLIGG
jgi:immediate early response 3-interacting protein 1